MVHRFPKLTGDEILDAEEIDRVLEKLAELMHRSTSPTLRAVLMEAADEIAELLIEDSEEDTEVEKEERAA